MNNEYVVFFRKNCSKLDNNRRCLRVWHRDSNKDHCAGQNGVVTALYYYLHYWMKRGWKYNIHDILHSGGHASLILTKQL